MAAMLSSHSRKTPAKPVGKESIDSAFSSDRWHLYTFGPSAVYMKQLSEESEFPDLFVVTGISAESMISTSRIIIMQLDTLKKKYHRIFIIKFCHTNDSLKRLHTKACDLRNKMKLEEKFVIIPAQSASEVPKQKWFSNRNQVYKSELDFYTMIAQLVNHIITKELLLTNVEVLGKSAGGCIAIHLVTMNPIYTALYLASPASPFNVSKLKELEISRKQSMHFHFGWPVNDIIYRDQKYLYDNMIDEIEIVNYKSQMYSMIDINDGHELHPDMINDICLY